VCSSASPGSLTKREELQLIARGVGGVILFSRNVREPSQVAQLAKELKQASKDPLLLCIDQEGGRVQRLRPPSGPPGRACGGWGRSTPKAACWA